MQRREVPEAAFERPTYSGLPEQRSHRFNHQITISLARSYRYFVIDARYQVCYIIEYTYVTIFGTSMHFKVQCARGNKNTLLYSVFKFSCFCTQSTLGIVEIRLIHTCYVLFYHYGEKLLCERNCRTRFAILATVCTRFEEGKKKTFLYVNNKRIQSLLLYPFVYPGIRIGQGLTAVRRSRDVVGNREQH